MYVTVNVPAPAVDGVNTPVLLLNPAVAGEILQVPPVVPGESVTGESVTQRSPGEQMLALQQVKAIGEQAEAAKVCTPPLLEEKELLPLPPQAMISPLVFTSTSYTLNEVE